jgi:hypothetical protein
VAKVAGFGEPFRDREPGPGVPAIKDVVGRFGPAWETSKPTKLAQRRELIDPARQELVWVGLVTGVPDDAIAWRLEQPVERDRQLDDAQ